MNFFDEINNLKHIYLTYLNEPHENGLIIRFTNIDISDEYEISFNHYISYNVTNEAYSFVDKTEARVGNLFCIYSKSNYLKFIIEHTTADIQHKGELIHYGINCLNHTIDIISLNAPIITKSN